MRSSTNGGCQRGLNQEQLGQLNAHEETLKSTFYLRRTTAGVEVGAGPLIQRDFGNFGKSGKVDSLVINSTVLPQMKKKSSLITFYRNPSSTNTNTLTQCMQSVENYFDVK